MTDETPEPEPSPALPSSLVETVRELSDHQLRELMSFSGDLLQYHDEQLLEDIEANPGEELVRVEKRDGYVEVVKAVPCGEDCAGCPHGPYLYHVRTAPTQAGDKRLRWEFIGRVRE
jgi:hypothetical protein